VLAGRCAPHVGTGSDVKQLWLQALTAACVIAVIVAVWARLGLGGPRALRGTAFAPRSR